MNGRTYDYNLGRFLSVDPFIQFPENSQSLNPYSYIMNNPMSGTDPTGYKVDFVEEKKIAVTGSRIKSSTQFSGSVDGKGFSLIVDHGGTIVSSSGSARAFLNVENGNGASNNPTTNNGNSVVNPNSSEGRFRMPGRVYDSNYMNSNEYHEDGHAGPTYYDPTFSKKWNKLTRLANSHSATERQVGIDEAIKFFNIDTKRAESVVYNSKLDLEGRANPNLSIEIGIRAFGDGAGWLGSSIYHEVLHVRKNYSSGFARTREENFLREVEVYNLEILMSPRFNLSIEQVDELKRRRDRYLDD